MPDWACSRTSWVIFIEQNFGPHIEQECASLAPSAGRVWPWKSFAGCGASGRLNWSGELRRVVGVGDRAGPQTVAQRERDVIGLHDLADLAEMRVEETLLVMRQAPLGHDRAASADDAGDPLGGQVDVGQAHAGMDGE